MIPISDGELKTNSRPYVNVTLIVICIAVFVFQLMMSNLEELKFVYEYAVIPKELTQGLDFSWFSAGGLLTTEELQALLSTDEFIGYDINRLQTEGYIVNVTSPVSNWMTVFTSMFMHGGWMHIIGNMLFLWVFGDNIEDKFGHFKYLLFYLASGVAAVLLHVAIGSSSEIPVVGASGAIAGVLGAYIVLFPFSRVRTIIFFIFITIVRIPAIILLGLWFLLQFFSGVGSLMPAEQGGGVAYWAHIGGFVVGLLVAVAYKSMIDRRGPWGSGGGDYDGIHAPLDDEPKYWRGRRL